MFIKNDNSTSRVNNFKHLEPTLQSLGISFDGTTAQELMQEKHGAATHLLYQLYVTLEKKTKIDISGNMPAVRLLKKEQDMYSDCQKHSPSLPRHQTSVRVHKSGKNKQQQQQQKQKQAQIVQKEIEQFETYTRKLVTFPSRDLLLEECSPQNEAHGVKAQSTQSNFQYIQQIRERLEVDAFAREQREKRAARFLVEQFKARKAEQDAQYEESLVKRLTRQTKGEERMVAQLLQIHSQKEVLLKNRLFREEQIQQRREKDFQEALEREAALVHQERLDREEETRRELDFCKRLAAERKQKRYKKHFESCKEIVGQIVDLATKAGQYRLLTGRSPNYQSTVVCCIMSSLVPGNQIRHWKELLMSGLPLYETLNEKEDQEDKQLDLMKQEILNDHDYNEYSNMVGEWAWPEETGQTNNNILGRVLVQLRNIAVKPSAPPLPDVSLKACVLGKVCSGKTTCLAKIAEAHGFYVLSIDKLVKEALNAHHSRAEVSELQKLVNNEDEPQFTRDNQDLQENITDTKLSTWAMFGAAADKEMREGKGISNELLVGMIAEAIRQIPANSGWILDGFPVDITQAYLLEKALGGTINPVSSNCTDLAKDSDTPKAPPTSAPALDLALLLEISDKSVASRAVNPTEEHNLAVISNRITAFQETWSDLEEWFGAKQNILVRVNANIEEEELLKTVASVLEQVKKQPPQGPLRKPSLSNENSYVDGPLPPDLAASLCLHWDAVSKSYVSKIKAVLQELRLQCAIIDSHLFNISEELKCYVGRPDVKQGFVCEWQRDFNHIPLDRKDEEETKAELHQRLDDLLEQLWDMSEKRKEENELKMAAVMEDGWLLDHTAALFNPHSTLIQIELDRFQDTLSILKTYYLRMYRQISIPLLDTADLGEKSQR